LEKREYELTAYVTSLLTNRCPQLTQGPDVFAYYLDEADPPYTEHAKKLISIRMEDVVQSGKLTVIGPMFGKEGSFEGRVEWDDVYSEIAYFFFGIEAFLKVDEVFKMLRIFRKNGL
jgi:hypothetical protein